MTADTPNYYHFILGHRHTDILPIITQEAEQTKTHLYSLNCLSALNLHENLSIILITLLFSNIILYFNIYYSSPNFTFPLVKWKNLFITDKENFLTTSSTNMLLCPSLSASVSVGTVTVWHGKIITCREVRESAKTESYNLYLLLLKKVCVTGPRCRLRCKQKRTLNQPQTTLGLTKEQRLE